MTNRNRLLIAILTLAIIVVAMLWHQRPASETLSSERIRASFARPVAVSAKGKTFSIQFDGQDVFKKTITLESGRNVDVVARFPPLDDPQGTKSQSLMIVPRLTSQGEDAFQWFDARIDKSVGWGGNRLVDPHQEHPPKEKVRFNLRPGDYRIRFYLEVQFRDPEQGMSEKFFLAEAPMIVSGPSQTGVVPLDDPKNTFRVDGK